MKVYLKDQKDKMIVHLAFLKSKKVMQYDKYRLKEKISSVQINTTKSLNDLQLDFLFDYQIFPSNILTFENEWKHDERKMKVGDTIVQQIYLPPIISFSQKIILGVRIAEIIDLPSQKGFSYETLEGHVEKGISSFVIEQTEDGITFKIHTYSQPGNFLSKLVGPFFSGLYQNYCTRMALKNVKIQLEVQ